jgi:RIO kinase 1
MQTSDDPVFEPFLEAGIVASVDGIVKSGKEATVWRCVAGPVAATASGFVAVKVYKEIATRSFRNMGGYLEGRIGRTVRGRRNILHMLSDEASMQAAWVDAEFSALQGLHGRSLPVPRPFHRTDCALAMDFVGDCEGGVSPQLVHARLGKDEAAGLYDRLVAAIVEMLRADIIHGDLSPYNILFHEGRLMVIDFPQAIDARYHSQAFTMFVRDLANVSAWFAKAGVGAADRIEAFAAETWEAYERNRL